MKGFGTVVTGTLISGTLKREEEVELYPTGRRLRVRGLQVYGEATDRARAGERTAVNLADIEPSEIARGMVLSEAGRFAPVTLFDCRLDLLSSAKALKNGAPVHLHVGAAEIEAEVRLLEKAPALAPGATAWARIVLREPALVLPGDRFIIRMFSPVATIGGGVVAAIGPHKYKRGADIAGRLAGLLAGNIAILIAERPNGISEAELISLTGLRTLPATPFVAKWFLAPERAAELKAKLLAAVRQFHREQSLLPGIPKQDLKGRVFPDGASEVFEHLLATTPELTQEGETVRLRTHRVVLKIDEEQARHSIEAAFATAGLAAPAVNDVLKSSGIESARARSILQILLREQKLIRISEELVLHSAALAVLREGLAGKKGQRFAVPEFKEWTGVSRKYAIPLLEYLDHEHITRREGDLRVVL
jgi:selenocysteine-specific elongation factor